MKDNRELIVDLKTAAGLDPDFRTSEMLDQAANTIDDLQCEICKLANDVLGIWGRYIHTDQCNFVNSPNGKCDCAHGLLYEQLKSISKVPIDG